MLNIAPYPLRSSSVWESSRCSNAFCSLLSANGMSPFFFTAPLGFLNNMVCWNRVIFCPTFTVLWLHRSHVTASITLFDYNWLPVISAVTECLSIFTEHLLSYLTAPQNPQTSGFVSEVPLISWHWREKHNTASIYTLPRYSVGDKDICSLRFMPAC